MSKPIQTFKFEQYCCSYNTNLEACYEIQMIIYILYIIHNSLVMVSYKTVDTLSITQKTVSKAFTCLVIQCFEIAHVAQN